MKKAFSTRNIVMGGIFIALAYLLPYLTGNLGELGRTLAPMHLPVLLAGYVAGAPVALIVGLVSPLLRSVLVGMPPMYPTAIAMAAELAAYGYFAGLFYKRLAKKPVNVYLSLILAMLCGRVVSGIMQFILYSAVGTPFTLATFISANFITILPAIVLQIVIIPILVLALRRAKVID